MKLWRVTNARFASTAMSGEGAYRYGGRWNSPGFRAVYLADSVALAALEIVAHAGSVVERYVAFEVDVPTRLVAVMPWDKAAPDWQRRDGWCRGVGDDWLRAQSSVGLRVPSAVLGTENPDRNVVVNMAHPKASLLVVGRSIDLWLDERLGPP